MKFRVKLSAILGLMAIAALVIGVVISFVGARKILDNKIKAHLESIVILKENMLNVFVESMASDIKLMVKDRLYREIFFEIPKTELRDLLNERLDNKEGFMELFVLDLDGQILVSTDESQEGKIKSYENYFIQGKKGLFIQSFYYDLALKQPSMIISVPIIDGRGKLSGLLVGRVDLKDISDLMTERTGLGETGETYLVNKFNFMITESRFEKGLALKNSIHTQGVKDCLNRKSGYDIYDNYRGTPVLGFYKWIPVKEACLLAEISQKEAFRSVQGLRNIIIITSIGIVILVIIFGYWFSRTISIPIEKLIEGTERIGKGDLKHRVELKTKDEFGTLAVAFNQMTERRQYSEEALKRSQDNLEIQVAERTAELRKANDDLNREITERKKAEEALREGEEELENIFNLSPDMISVCTPEGKIVKVNPSCEKILGYTVDEVQKLGWAKLVHPDDVERTNKEVESQLKGHSVMNYINRYKCKEGTYKLLEWRATPVIEGIIYATARDITEKKQLEEQLQTRQRMDSLGTLAGGIAHDFNNLLTGILGYIDLLNLHSENLTETQKEYISNAVKSSQRAADLVMQLQTLSRGVVTKKKSVDLYETVDEVFQMLDKTTDRLIKKEVRMDPGEFYITANTSELHQVFLNLGTNAVHSIEERGVKPGDYIRVSAEDYTVSGVDITGLAEEEYVHIIFEDNGCGMPDEVKRKAFDPLFTTKEKGGRRGQGLGLAMVFNIVTKRHEGHIDIESEEGKGTVFHIYLPKRQSEEKSGVDDQVLGGDETVLIIEDEEQVSQLAETLLEEYRYKVLTAADGEEGLGIYARDKETIDIVLLDLTMPKMSGQMVFEKIRSINPDVKIIICSGQSDEDIRKGILSTAGGFLKKPYRINDLARTVREVLDS